MIIVTGASGHIGNVLVRKLIARGEKVGVISVTKEEEPSLEGLEYKKYVGDIRDLDFLRQVISKDDIVYHLAGIVSIVTGQQDLLYDVNVNGTKNIVKVCVEKKVKRLLYTSSVHALNELPKGQYLVEELESNVDEVLGDYARSKVLATREVYKGIKLGLDTVITYPSGVIGPFDFRPSEMGNVIKSYLKGEIRFFIDGAYNFVDVRDEVDGIISAMEKGRSGESYILAGNLITVKELFTLLNKLTKTNRKTIKVPSYLAHFFAFFVELGWKLFKIRPLFTPYAISVLESNSLISSEKAKKELNYKIRSSEESIQDTLRWFRGEEISLD